MEISYDITLEDLLAFSRHCLGDEGFRSLRRKGWGLIAVGALTLGPLVVMPFLTGRVPTIFGAAAAFGIVLLLLGSAILRAGNIARKPGPLAGPAREKMLVQPWAKQGIGPTRVTLDDEGVVEERRLTTLAFDWAAVDRIVDGPDHILIYLGDKTGTVIPKRATTDPAGVLRLINESLSRARAEPNAT